MDIIALREHPPEVQVGLLSGLTTVYRRTVVTIKYLKACNIIFAVYSERIVE